MSHPEAPASKLAALPPWAARTLALLVGVSVALLLALLFLAWLLFRGDGRVAVTEEMRREAVRQMAASNGGLYDAHPDADVRRLLTAQLRDFEHRGVAVEINSFGLRERDFEVPKPEGALRIVLLGDSMVYGWGAPAEDRLGVHLERFLEERRNEVTDAGPVEVLQVEVLHVGVPSWTLHNQATYLRRRLSLIQPDLVLHLLVPNDIEDDTGVRGFGAASSFSPRHPGRGDALLHSNVPAELRPDAEPSLLRLGFDFESRRRFDELRREVEELAALLARCGTSYRVLFHFRRLSAIAWEQAGRELEESLGVETLYTSIDFATDTALFVAPNDPHWNRRGHERMAQVFFELIRREQLLPALELAPWPEAAEAYEEIAGEGRREAMKKGKAERLRERHGEGVRRAIDFDALDARAASQVHGGVDADGLLMPYASLLLRGGGSALHLLAEPLGRPEIDGARLRLFVDGEAVGEIVLDGRTIDRRFAIPPASRQRPFLTARFEASDFVHAGEDMRRCRVLRLRRVAVEP